MSTNATYEKDTSLNSRSQRVWNAIFPGQIPNQLVIAEELEENTIDLEGNELRVVELGHSDGELYETT
jgi:hypothetical protein